MKMRWLCIACFAGLLVIVPTGIAQDRPASHRRIEIMRKIFNRLK